MTDSIRIAGVQMDVAIGDKARNLSAICERLQEAADAEARLVVFPECSLTGYCFESLDEAIPYGEKIPGPSTEQVAEVCASCNTRAVYGLLEIVDDRLYNAAALVGPDGLIAKYRKIHLPGLGVDHFTTPGDAPLAVHDLGDVRVGVNICYDSGFPESSRVMALAGADLVVLPTNFPPGAQCMVEHVVPARAMENAIYYLAVNRVGEERGFHFIGQSKLCNPDGQVLAFAGPDEEKIFMADIELEQARVKRRVRVPGKHEIDRFADRRPEFYGPIVEPRSG